MEWQELKQRVQELRQPAVEKELHTLQREIRDRFAALDVEGVGGSFEEVLDWLDRLDVAKKGTDAHRYALRTLDDIIDRGQGLFVRDSLESLFRHLAEALETLRR